MRLGKLAVALVVITLLTSANCFADHRRRLHVRVGPNTLRRRINSFPDSAISLQHDLGVSQLQLPEVLLSFWFDDVNPVQFQFRYLETHWRVIYASPDWRGFSQFAGFNYNYAKYTQTSSGVGNLLRVQLYGPEVGFNWSI